MNLSAQPAARAQDTDIVHDASRVDSSTIEVAQPLNDVLRAAGLSARLRFDNKTIVVGGAANGTKSIIEFRFASREIFERLVSSLRLYDFAKAFFDQQLDVVGPFTDAVDVLYAINLAADKRRTLLEQAGAILFRIAKATIPSIALRFDSDAHYSMNAEAYELFLDHYMQYTCGKALSPSDDLDQMQVNKFRLIEDLVRQNRGWVQGIKHLDIGCGWGGLLAYFTQQLATDSVGNTNSQAQKAYAESHYGAKVELGDFSQALSNSEAYDLVTIIGMAEHLTPRRRTQLFQAVRRSLKREGLVYFQCIARPSAWIGGDAYRLAYEDVFPGHYLESRTEMERRFEALGFEILFAADDAMDYSKTTALWAGNIERNHVRMAELVGERSYRILLSYLAYASKLFASDRGSLMRYMLRLG